MRGYCLKYWIIIVFQYKKRPSIYEYILNYITIFILFNVYCAHFFFTGFGVEVLKVSPTLITTVSGGLFFVVLAIIIVVRLKSANDRKRNARQTTGDKQDVIVHQRSNGQVATSILETDMDPDLIQVKYGKNHFVLNY